MNVRCGDSTFSLLEVEEAISNVKEATELHLEKFPLKGEEKSFITIFEVASVAKP
jgi:hypothetical protein